MRPDPKLWKKVRSLLYVSTGGFTIFAGYSLYNAHEGFYNKVFMPVVHKLDPETSHKFAITVGKYSLLPRSRYRNPEELATEVWGIKFANPIGLAAGFDKDGEAVNSMLDIGFGFVEVGSVTPLSQPGNEKPRVFRVNENSAIINRYGFNSKGHDIVAENLKNISSTGVVGVNLGKNKTSPDPVQDYVKGIEKFSPTADYLVINISSPNTPGLRSLQEKEILSTLLQSVVAARNVQPHRRPLLLKLSPDLTEQQRVDIAEVISRQDCQIDGLIISNTTINRPEIVGQVADEAGGLSGRPLHEASTKLIYDMYKLTNGKIPIVGVGGVFTGQDAFEKVAAGASLIQLYTALAYHGPPRVTKVKEELAHCLRKEGFKSLSEAVGSQHKSKSTHS